MEFVTVGESRIAILSAIRGLVSEGERVRAAIHEVQPEAVGLSVGREDLEGLIAYEGGDHEPANWEEELYVAGLRQWGDVRKPPPCFVEALAAAAERGTAVHPLDLDEEQYSTLYVSVVSTVDILLSNARQGRLQRWTSKAGTPEAFVREWDARVNGSEGYRRLQAEREAFIARRIRQLASRYGALLALVEVERADGVLGRLRA